MKNANSVALRICMANALAAAAACLTAAPVAAATLDAKAAQALAAEHTWQIKKPRGPGNDFWSWKADGSVCVRLGEKTGKCADTGKWRLDGERICYELTWWGAQNGLKSTCFRVDDQGKGRYAALEDNGLTMFEFSLEK
jgi:hypothetical protein